MADIICNFLITNGVSSEYVCRHENVKTNITLAFLDENNDATGKKDISTIYYMLTANDISAMCSHLQKNCLTRMAHIREDKICDLL